MLTLSAVKSEIGISASDMNADADLLRAIRQVVHRVRQRTSRGIAWVTDSIEAEATTAKLRVIGHGWRTGQVVTIAGSDTTPTLNGEKTITRVDEDHVRVTGTLSDVGTQFATLHPTVTIEANASSLTRLWVPESVTPFLSVDQLEDRTSETEWEDVDAEDYELVDDSTISRAVQIHRTVGTFPVAARFERNQWALRQRSRFKTSRITVWTGAPVLPEDVVMAALSMVCDLWSRAGRGKDEQSFSYEGANRTSMSGAERMSHVLSPEPVLLSWTAR